MTNEPEWRDANPATADLPNKGRSVIICIVGGLAMGVLAIIGLRFRIVGLAVGGGAFFTGIGMLYAGGKSIIKPPSLLPPQDFSCCFHISVSGW